MFSFLLFDEAIVISTQIYHFQYKKKKKITLNYPKSAAMGLFEGTQERVQNSHGKPAISIQGTEGLLCNAVLN